MNNQQKIKNMSVKERLEEAMKIPPMRGIAKTHPATKILMEIMETPELIKEGI